MSGYIHVLKTLTSDPRFTRLARALLKHTDSTATKEFGETLALGCLVKLWLRADSHIRDDDTLELGADEIDEFLGVDGVTKILEPNWTQILDADHVKLPNYVAHNGIEARRMAQATARQAKHRAKGSNGQALHAVTEPVTQERDITSRLDVTPPSPLIPSQPLPSPTSSQPSPGDREHAARAPTAQRLPADFELTEDRKATARAEAVNPEREFARFCDHWRASGGSNARKRDWDAAWRNWCRKSGDFGKGRGTAGDEPKLTWRPPADDPEYGAPDASK